MSSSGRQQGGDDDDDDGWGDAPPAGGDGGGGRGGWDSMVATESYGAARLVVDETAVAAQLPPRGLPLEPPPPPPAPLAPAHLRLVLDIHEAILADNYDAVVAAVDLAVSNGIAFLSVPVGKFKRTALHHAAFRGNPRILGHLLDFRAARDVKYVSAADKYKLTPLDIAAARGNVECVRILCGNTRFIEIKSSEDDTLVGGQDRGDSRTPLHRAAERGDLACATIIAESLGTRAGFIDQCDNLGQTALHLAAHGGHVDVVRFLLQRQFRTRLDIIDRRGRTALHLACLSGSPNAVDVADMLLRASPEGLMAKDSDAAGVLHFAASAGNEPLVSCIIAHFLEMPGGGDLLAAELGHKDSHERTPLARLLSTVYRKTREGEEKVDLTGIADKFLQAGANPEAEVSSSDMGWAGEPAEPWSLLHAAASLRLSRYLELLLAPERRASAFRRSPINGLTPLHVACAKGRHLNIRCLCRAGADVQAVDAMGHTPLMVAAMFGRSDSIAELARVRGVDVNSVSPVSGLPAIALAIETNEEADDKGQRTVSALVKAGARRDMHIRTMDEQKAERADTLLAYIVRRYAKRGKMLCALLMGLDRRILDERSPLDGLTALCVAARRDRAMSMCLLLQAGAGVDEPDARGYTPLYHAMSLRHTTTTALLLIHGANLRTAIDRLPPHVLEPTSGSMNDRLLKFEREDPGLVSRVAVWWRERMFTNDRAIEVFWSMFGIGRRPAIPGPGQDTAGMASRLEDMSQPTQQERLDAMRPNPADSQPLYARLGGAVVDPTDPGLYGTLRQRSGFGRLPDPEDPGPPPVTRRGGRRDEDGPEPQGYESLNE